MCLNYISDSPMEKSGIAYKVVRKTENPGVFSNLWPFMFVGRKGGTFEERPTKSHPEKRVPSKTFYKIGEPHIVKHRRMTRPSGSTIDEPKYRAGVHLYKTLDTAFRERYTHPQSPTGGDLIIKCEYQRAVAHDDETIVALEITPIKVISSYSEECSNVSDT